VDVLYHAQTKKRVKWKKENKEKKKKNRDS
jgi:hypothetical protein